MSSKEKDSKQYGLIIPKKNVTEVKRPTIFNEDSDSAGSDVGTSDWIKKSYQKQAASSGGLRRQTQIDMKKALDQDATVYQYDEIYDQLEKKKTEKVKLEKQEKKKPRYIQSLLLKAQARKLENERRIEREVQKERDAEGEEFKDKETFVTSAYKKKLEEFNKLDEEERRQDMLEDICDVSKQQDLGGFYRHLYKTTVDNENTADKNKEESDKKKGKEKPSDEKASVPKETTNPLKAIRQYRKRKNSESAEEGETGSDSDTSISSSSSDSSSSSGSSKSSVNTKKDKKSENKKKPKQQKVSDKTKKTSEPETKNTPNGEEDTSNNNNRNSQDKENIEIKKPDNPVPKINIWEKRTVGTVFDEALKRYFERKSLKLAQPGN